MPGTDKRGRTAASPADALGSLLTALLAWGGVGEPLTPLDRPGTPSLRLPGLCWAAGCQGEASGPVQPPLLEPPFVRRPRGSALGASLWRDTLRPDTSTQRRRTAEGKGGAVWRRDRSRAQPRAGPLGPSMASTARTHPLPVASTVAPLFEPSEAPKVVHSAKFKFSSSDSGPRKLLISLTKKGSNRSKRAGR